MISANASIETVRPLDIEPPLRRPVVLVGMRPPEERRALASLLTLYRYRPIAVSEGEHVIDFLQWSLDELSSGAHPPIEAAIFGLDLGAISGLDILATIQERGWAFPCVLLLRPDEEAARETAYALGAYAVFRLPYDAEDLVTAVHNMFWYHGRPSTRTSAAWPTSLARAFRRRPGGRRA